MCAQRCEAKSKHIGMYIWNSSNAPRLPPPPIPGSAVVYAAIHRVLYVCAQRCQN